MHLRTYPLLAALALLLLGGAPLWAQSGWEAFESPVTTNLNGVDFTSPLVGTAVGDRAVILRTTDGAATWTAQPTTGLEPETMLRGVSFYDADHGTVTGLSGTILATADGGAAWQTVQTGWMIDYHAVHHVAEAEALIAGRNSILQPMVTGTTDGWQSMEHYPFYIEIDEVGCEGTARDVCVGADNAVFVACQVWDGRGAIVRSLNAGESWDAIYVTPLGPVLSIAFGSPAHGIAVGADGSVHRTVDGGETWASLGAQAAGHLYAVAFGNDTCAWAVGEGGVIIRTTDAGATWAAQESPVTADLHAVDFVDGLTGYVVGAGGVIIKTTSGGEIVNLPPGEFARVAPADNSLLPRGEIPLRWTRAVDPEGDPVTYTVQVWTSIEGTWQPDQIMVDDTFYTLTYPETYHGEVQLPVRWLLWAHDDHEHSIAPANGEGHFTVDAASPARNAPGALPASFGLACYPNPFNPATTLSLTLPQASAVRLRVYDVQGREVQAADFGVLAAGSHALRVDGSALAAGVYFARLEAGATPLATKLMLLK